jgi:hypothetical protein
MQIIQKKEEHKKDKTKKETTEKDEGEKKQHGENDLSRTLSITR